MSRPSGIPTGSRRRSWCQREGYSALLAQHLDLAAQPPQLLLRLPGGRLALSPRVRSPFPVRQLVGSDPQLARHLV
jgi:hypothetical protein